MEIFDGMIEFEQVFCFKCPECEFVSRVKNEVSEHLKKDHQVVIAEVVNANATIESSDFLLNGCDEEPNEINDSQILHHDPVSSSVQEGFTCTVEKCGVRWELEHNAQYHTKCHYESGFRCPECSEIKSSWKAMTMHLWKSHSINLELLSCHLCGYKTGKKELLKFHIKTHCDQRTCLCDECGKGFKNMKQLRNHKELHSLNKGSKEQLKNKCADCGKILSSGRLLRAHRNAVHLKMRSHLCSYCGYNTTSHSSLRIHLRQHTNEKPFTCETCNYQTADHNSLRRHRMKHTGEKRYKCPHCPYASIQASTYKVHLKNKHPGLSDELVFSCQFCSFRTIRKEQLSLHTTCVHAGGNQVPEDAHTVGST